MAALTKDRNTRYKGKSPVDDAYPVAAGVVIHAGAIVNANAAGYAKPGTNTAGETFLGVSDHSVDNTGGGDGDVEVSVRSESAFELEGPDAVANHGKEAFVADDQTVGTSGNVSVGRFAEIDASSGKPWVRVRTGGA